MNGILLVQSVQAADLCRSFNACFRRNIVFCTEMKSRQSVCNIFFRKIHSNCYASKVQINFKGVLTQKKCFFAC